MLARRSVVRIVALLASATAKAAHQPRSNSTCKHECHGLLGTWRGCKSSYTDGVGTKLDTVDEDSDGNCWTDVFVVNNTLLQRPWRKVSDLIDCGGGGDCSVTSTNTSSDCISTSVSTMTQDGVSFLLAQAFYASSMSASFQISQTVTHSSQQCITSSYTTQCGPFGDSECHALWASDAVVRSYGYIRRQCLGQQTEVTMWSHDFDFDSPTGSTTPGCAALCSDPTYPHPNLSPNYKTIGTNGTCRGAAWSGAKVARPILSFLWILAFTIGWLLL